MENSVKSSMSKAVSDDEQESGWTVYFDELFDDEYHEENNSCFSSSDLESSLISDAATSVVKKSAHDDHDINEQAVKMGLSLDLRRCDRLMSSKKRKTKAVHHLVDNDLEDTASSPVNSPKIYNLMSQLERKPAETKDIMDMSQEKGSTSGQVDERNNESELKKRGLCLVPLSMLVNYLG